MTADPAAAPPPGHGDARPHDPYWSPGRVGYWLTVAAALALVWAFPYTPTQDGPAHLANAVLRAGYGEPGTMYHHFYSLSDEPVPNWTTQALLWGLVQAVPPLVAEKVLLSLYILGMAWAVLYLAGAFGPVSMSLAATSLLLLFPRCFFMGFYNSCCSLVVVLIVLGYCARRQDGFGPWGPIALGLLFLAAYFTHLVGWALAVLAAAWLAVGTGHRRASKALVVATAVLPSGFLVYRYLAGHGAVSDGTFGGITAAIRHAWSDPQGCLANRLGESSPVIDLFEPLDSARGPFAVVTFVFLCVVAAVCAFPSGAAKPRHGSARAAFMLFSLAVALLYLLLPDDLGEAGGYLCLRLAPLPPLVWLACVRPPRWAESLVPLSPAVFLITLCRLAHLGGEMQAANGAIREYTAGVGYAEPGQVMYVVQSQVVDHRRVNYLLHASDYYCLRSGVVNLDNYQATKPYFQVRYRTGIERGRGDFVHYPNREAVNLVLVWDWPGKTPFQSQTEWKVRYRKGELTLFTRCPD